MCKDVLGFSMDLPVYGSPIYLNSMVVKKRQEAKSKLFHNKKKMIENKFLVRCVGCLLILRVAPLLLRHEKKPRLSIVGMRIKASFQVSRDIEMDL